LVCRGRGQARPLHAAGALILFVALARGGRDWAGAEPTFTVLAAAAGWTVLAGGSAVWLSRRTRWLAGLSCLAFGAVPAAAVAVDLLFLLPR